MKSFKFLLMLLIVSCSPVEDIRDGESTDSSTGDTTDTTDPINPTTSEYLEYISDNKVTFRTSKYNFVYDFNSTGKSVAVLTYDNASSGAPVVSQCPL